MILLYFDIRIATCMRYVAREKGWVIFTFSYNYKEICSVLSFFLEICRIKGSELSHNEAGLHSHHSHVQSRKLTHCWKKRIGAVHVLTCHMGSLDLKSFAYTKTLTIMWLGFQAT